MKTTCAAAALILLATPAWSQTYEVSWSTVSGGGAMGLAGGAFEMDTTTGQAGAGGPFAGGTFVVQSGFWSFLATGVLLQADLSLTNTDNQSAAVPGQPIAYAIVASNAGPTALSGATVSDTPPASINGVTWTCTATPGSSCPASGTGAISATINLAVGGSATFSLNGTVDPAATGSLSNTAAIAVPSGVLDPNSTNNSATDTDTLTPLADLAVVQSDSPDPVLTGGTLTYTIEVTNVGPSTVTATTLTETLPSAVTFVSSTPGAPTCTHVAGVVTCNLGTMSPSGQTTISLTTTVNPGAAGTLTSTAAVSGGAPDPIAANNTETETTQVTLRGRAELVHGTDVRTDLRAVGSSSNVHLYRVRQQPFASYEVVVDSTSGDIGAGAGPLLERVAADGTSVLQTSRPVGVGPSRTLRFANSTSSAIDDQLVRIRSASCGSDCGPDDVYRIRTWETTGVIPRFNSSASQVTVVLLFNASTESLSGEIRFWSANGTALYAHSFSLTGRAFLSVNTATLPIAGQSGSITVWHDGPHGALTGKAVALEPATGFSFDSPLQFRLR